METTKPLIQQLIESHELTRIREESLKTYYTCVRYKPAPINTSAYKSAVYPSLGYNESHQWSCVKGRFEPYDDSFKGRVYELKGLNYCRFRDTDSALTKDIKEPFVQFVPADSSKN